MDASLGWRIDHVVQKRSIETWDRSRSRVQETSGENRRGCVGMGVKGVEEEDCGRPGSNRGGQGGRKPKEKASASRRSELVEDW